MSHHSTKDESRGEIFNKLRKEFRKLSCDEELTAYSDGLHDGWSARDEEVRRLKEESERLTTIGEDIAQSYSEVRAENKRLREALEFVKENIPDEYTLCDVIEEALSLKDKSHE